MPRLIAARHVRDFVVWRRFSDGAEGEVDLAGELDGPIFEPLRDPAYFRLVTLDPGVHTIAWPNGADLAPSSCTSGSAARPDERRAGSHGRARADLQSRAAHVAPGAPDDAPDARLADRRPDAAAGLRGAEGQTRRPSAAHAGCVPAAGPE
jgi:hypothetical protein